MLMSASARKRNNGIGRARSWRFRLAGYLTDDLCMFGTFAGLHPLERD